MIDVKDVVEKEKRDRKLAFERIEVLSGISYKDCSTVIVVPTRGTIHYKVTAAWDNLIAPMNQKRSKFYAVGEEVGRAYTAMIKNILNDEVLSKYKFILTLEDDNVPPPDAHLKLLESIEFGPFDAVSGLYYTKGDLNMPMAYGDPKEFVKNGVMDFKPRNIAKALETGNIMEVNGIGMGCALWRMDLFREMPPPWFVTVQEYIPFQGMRCLTQDLEFCERLRKEGKRVAVDMRVCVGHVDPRTGVMY